MRTGTARAREDKDATMSIAARAAHEFRVYIARSPRGPQKWFPKTILVNGNSNPRLFEWCIIHIGADLSRKKINFQDVDLAFMWFWGEAGGVLVLFYFYDGVKSAEGI